MIDDEGGVLWIEEPIRADDFSGCSEVRREVRTPIQIGENFMGPEQMAQALAAGACDYVMPDAQRIGGVTGWMRAAALAQAAGLGDVEPPLPRGEHAPSRRYADRALARVRGLGRRRSRGAVRVKDGADQMPETAGDGMAWNEEAVRRYQIDVRRGTSRIGRRASRRRIELPRETVYANLVASAARYPERAAIDYYGRRIATGS